MKSVTLKRIKFVNFKGIKDLSVSMFDRTTISGANGRGKTTIFDGFTWVLFGKNSKDEAEFGIKTVDANMQPIPRLPHEVEVVLDVNGDEVTLTRRYNEVWRRDKDSNGEERMQGHEVERLYNGVPCSVKDWNEKIAEIIKEDIFKYTTNPHYFSAQKSETQRALLFKMAGGVTDAEIIASDPQFVELFAKVGNKTLKQFEDETKSALTRVRKELSDLPARIDERKRDEVAAEDWAALEAEIAERTAELQCVEDAIADKAKAITAASEAREALALEIIRKKRERDLRAEKVCDKAKEEYNEAKKRVSSLDSAIWSGDISKTADLNSIERAEKNIEQLLKEREVLLNEYNTINAEQLVFNDKDFTCPICGRLYEQSEIESKKSEITELFNAEKASKLAKNKEKGLEVRDKIERERKTIEAKRQQIADKDAEIAKAKAEKETLVVVVPDYDALIAADAEYAQLSATVADLEAQLSQAPTEIADTELQSKKRTLTADLDTLKSRLAKREQIKANAERIRELEAALATNGNEEARLKGLLYAIKEFSKARSRAISDRVNGLFSYVKFKLFDTQVNGEEVEVCEATMNGVPYSVLSNGEKIVAGLDIIRTIQRYVGVSAPIFIDNAEAVSGYPIGLLEELGQVVYLRVTEEETLTVKEG